VLAISLVLFIIPHPLRLLDTSVQEK